MKQRRESSENHVENIQWSFMEYRTSTFDDVRMYTNTWEKKVWNRKQEKSIKKSRFLYRFAQSYKRILSLLFFFSILTFFLSHSVSVFSLEISKTYQWIIKYTAYQIWFWMILNDFFQLFKMVYDGKDTLFPLIYDWVTKSPRVVYRTSLSYYTCVFQFNNLTSNFVFTSAMFSLPYALSCLEQITA